jgi:hypothetical protein
LKKHQQENNIWANQKSLGFGHLELVNSCGEELIRNIVSRIHDCILVIYMASRFGLLGVGSRNFSNAEKERTASKAEQIHKMTIISTPNGPRLSFLVKIVAIL